MLTNNDYYLLSYLQQLFGEKVHFESLDVGDIKGVALYLKHSYRYLRTEVMGRELVLAISITDEAPPPVRARQNADVISRALGKPVALVFRSIETYQIRRYVQQGVPFIIPCRQLFIPSLFMDLKEPPKTPVEKRIHFRPATQCLLIHHLWFHPLQGMDQKSITEQVPYSGMTISRAVEEWRNAGLLLSRGNGLQFPEDRHELWTRAVPHLRSPVRTVRYARELASDIPYRIAGMNALAHYTNLSGDPENTYAVYSRAVNRLGNQSTYEARQSEDDIKLELWRYPPDHLTMTEYVDPFSLYLSIADQNTDERVAIALDEMVEGAL